MPATFPSLSRFLILLNQQKFLYVLYLSLYQKPLSIVRNTKRKSKATFVCLSNKILFSSGEFHRGGILRLWSSTVQVGATQAREEVKREGFRIVFGSSLLRISARAPTILRFALTRADIFYTLTTAAADWRWFVQRQP